MKLNRVIPWVIIALTFICYIPSLQNQFLHWDDSAYISDNPQLRNLNAANAFSFFSNAYNNTYIPLTMLTWAVEYQVHGDHPLGYILLNIILHLANTWLVYLLVLQWTKKRNIALICMALFGLNPIHVESVVWITERKDVLYAFFFFLSLFQYNRFLQERKRGKLLLSLIFFVLSLLSKGQAVTLPLVLLLVDFLNGRKILSKKVITEKIPFFCLAILFGFIALYFQKSYYSSGRPMYYFPVSDKVYLSSYALIQYIFKTLIPLKLSAGYPLPKPYEILPQLFKFYLFPALAFIFLIIILYWKKSRFAFGTAFFFVNILFMLDHSSVGKFIMADRFVYVASLGLFLVLGEFTAMKWSMNKVILPMVSTILIICIVIEGTLTFIRVQKWKNEKVLFLDTVSKYLDNPVAWNELGCYYLNNKSYDSSMVCLNKALLQLPSFPDAMVNKGLWNYRKNRNDTALYYFKKAVQISPSLFQAWHDIGLVWLRQDKYKEAETAFNRAITESNEKFLVAYLNRAEIYLKLQQPDSAIRDCKIVLKQDPNNPEAYQTMGKILEEQKDYTGAMADYNKAIRLKPENPVFLYSRAVLRGEILGDLEGSFEDLQHILELDREFYSAMNDLGIIYSMRRESEKAMKFFNRCLELDPDFKKAYVNRGILYLSLGNKEKAKEDILHAMSLHADVPERILNDLGLN